MKMLCRVLAATLLCTTGFSGSRSEAAPPTGDPSAKPTGAAPASAARSAPATPGSAAPAGGLSEAEIGKGLELAVVLLEELSKAVGTNAGDCDAIAKAVNAFVDGNQARIDTAKQAGAQASGGQAMAVLGRLEARITAASQPMSEAEKACADHEGFNAAKKRTQ